jgi:hypothetical protein
MRWIWLLAVFAACAQGETRRIGRTVYRPSTENGGGYGYSDVQLNGQTFRVTFVATSPREARDGALLRAAEVTLLAGADGFVIAQQEDLMDQATRTRFVVGRVRRNIPTTVLTINPLLRREFARVPPGTTVYDARLIAPQPGN